MSSISKTRKRLKRLWTPLQEGQPEAVHEVRKLTRRAQAEQHVAGSSGHLRREWRALRQTVAVLRDRDVVGAYLMSALAELEAPLTDVEQFRAAWASRRDTVLSELSLPERPSSYVLPGHWKRKVRATLSEDQTALREELAKVMASQDPEIWHTFRKHLKRYRYTTELLDDEAPEVVLNVLDQLGQIQDAQVVLDVVNREAWLPSYREQIIGRVTKIQDQAREAVREHVDELNRHFAGTPVPA